MLLVSASDKLANTRAILGDYRQIGEEVWKRFSGGRDGTLWYYRTLTSVLLEKTPASPLVLELARVVSDLETLAARAQPIPEVRR